MMPPLPEKFLVASDKEVVDSESEIPPVQYLTLEAPSRAKGVPVSALRVNLRMGLRHPLQGVRHSLSSTARKKVCRLRLTLLCPFVRWLYSRRPRRRRRRQLLSSICRTSSRK